MPTVGLVLVPTTFFEEADEADDDDNLAVLIMEPMLATGGSACRAIEIILEQGAREEDLVFVNVVASARGIEIVTKKFPRIKIVTAAIDAEIDHHG